MTLLSKRTLAGLSAGAGLGLLLAGLSVGLWWGLDVRHRPVRLAENADSIDGALRQAAAVSLGEGERPVHIVGPRDSSVFETWALHDAAALMAKGRGVNVTVIPSGYGGSAEEATIAEFWLRPRLALWKEWMAQRADHWTAAGLVPVRRDPLRQQALSKAQVFSEDISSLADADGRWPLIFWRDPSGALVLCICDTDKAQTKAREMLGLRGMPESIVPQNLSEPAPIDEPTKEAVASYAYPQGLSSAVEAPKDIFAEALNEPNSEMIQSETASHANYGPSPRLPGDAPSQSPSAVSAQSRAAPTSQPVRRQPVARAVNTAPPEAQKDSESLFY